ncbi:MAG: hypothetical protein MZW92_39120 [Comamonadaceae bacterium]|nr:hypothetical protein [Comamonadaceae bacterium]
MGEILFIALTLEDRTRPHRAARAPPTGSCASACWRCPGVARGDPDRRRRPSSSR